MPQLSFHTPVGELTLCEEDGAIVAIEWGRGGDQTETALLLATRTLLDAYFDGAAVLFDVPLAPAGGTPYRRKVWDALCGIPPGETRTYGEICRIAGGSPRSVGTANGANPIPILIPCHRVLAGGGIGGYSGGAGVPTKRYLLELEARSYAAGSAPLLSLIEPDAVGRGVADLSQARAR